MTRVLSSPAQRRRGGAAPAAARAARASWVRQPASALTADGDVPDRDLGRRGAYGGGWRRLEGAALGRAALDVPGRRGDGFRAPELGEPFRGHDTRPDRLGRGRLAPRLASVMPCLADPGHRVIGHDRLPVGLVRRLLGVQRLADGLRDG